MAKRIQGKSTKEKPMLTGSVSMITFLGAILRVAVLEIKKAMRAKELRRD